MCYQGNNVVLQGVWCTTGPGNRWCPSSIALAFRFLSAREWLISFRRSALRKTKRYANSNTQTGHNNNNKNTYLLGQYKFDERSHPKQQGGNQRAKQTLTADQSMGIQIVAAIRPICSKSYYH